MRFAVQIGGIRHWLNPAAISCIRYRAEYGRSIVTDLLAAQSGAELELCFIRMVHAMIPPDDHVDLLEFAARCRTDQQFFAIAIVARDALLEGKKPAQKELATGEQMDEYKILAMLAATGVSMTLIYELPIMHLLEVVSECCAVHSNEEQRYVPMTEKQMSTLYPR